MVTSQPCVPSTASMGPQLVSCGCVASARVVGVTENASMGPQLVSCGCIDLPIASAKISGLQWGRSS